MLKSERLILKKPELEDVDKILKIQNIIIYLICG